jgi:hypothetical protein
MRGYQTRITRKKKRKKLEQEEVADGSIFNNKEEIATHATNIFVTAQNAIQKQRPAL